VYELGVGVTVTVAVVLPRALRIISRAYLKFIPETDLNGN